MIIRTPEARADALEAGRRAGAILEALARAVRPGLLTADLDRMAEELIRSGGDKPAFLGYTPEGASRPYPATLCVSVNDEVVHGVPTERPRVLAEGDIASLDFGLIHNGIIVDTAVTVPVGEVDSRTGILLSQTNAALVSGVRAARVGNRIGDISDAIVRTMKYSGFSLVKVLGGHGVGAGVHEEPFIPNVGMPGTGPEIVEGMMLAIEPIANAGKAAVVLRPDGYTYATRDGSRSAHFEHTILVDKEGPIVLTMRPSEAS